MTLIGLLLIAGLLLVIIGLVGILLTMAEDREDLEGGGPSGPSTEGDPFAEDIETTTEEEEHGDAV